MMTRSDTSKQHHKSSKINMLKKIGITFIIPIFLAIIGAFIVLTSCWNYISSAYTYSTLIFSRNYSTEGLKDSRPVYYINGKRVYRPYLGDSFGKIKISSVDLELPLIEGDEDEQLNKGAAHYRYSTLPGEGGNVLLSSHRDSLFAPLQYANIGDEVILEMSYGTYYYKISNIYTTTPDDESVGAVSDYEKLTMYTCYPFDYVGSAPYRRVFVCDFVKVEG